MERTEMAKIYKTTSILENSIKSKLWYWSPRSQQTLATCR